MIKLTSILSEILNEDRCKRIADRKYDKPSAYKSGAIVRCRDGKIWKDLKEDDTPKYKDNNIIYHAGDKKLTKLIPDFIKGGTRANYGWGVYFTSSINKARDYGKEITYLDISDMNILELADMVDDSLIKKIDKLAVKTKKQDSILGSQYEVIAGNMKKYIGKTIYDAWRSIFSSYTWNTDKLWAMMLVKIGYDIVKYGYEYVVINLDKANHYLVDEKTSLPHGTGKYKNPDESKKISLDDIIPDTEENSDLRRIVINSDDLTDVKSYLNRLKDIQDKVKNLRDYDELERQIELLNKLIDSDFDFYQLNEKQKESLHTWFKRQGPSGKEGGWVDCNTCRKDKSGKKKCKSCGRKEGESRSKYPSCRPTPSQCSQPGKGKKWGKTK
jgi:hypothetical protein